MPATNLNIKDDRSTKSTELSVELARRLSLLKRVPGQAYYYDFGTSNTSFLTTATQLRKGGVKNCAFMLTLYNPELIGVDPFSPNLNQAQVAAVQAECMLNPWYFLREVDRVPNPGGAPLRYLLNRATAACIWCFLNGIDSYLTISRQIGKTESVVGAILWAFLFGTSNTQMLFMNINQEKANSNLERLKKQREELPAYLQLRYKIVDFANDKVDKGINNTKTISCPINGNKIVTGGKATSKTSATQIGRGASQTIQYFDEVEFIEWIGDILKASGPAFVTASGNARKNKAVTARLFTSTPGDLDSAAGKDAQEILGTCCKWSESFYDKPIAEVVETIKSGGIANICYIEYPYKLLVKEPKSYFSKMRTVLLGNIIDIKREILLQRIHGSSESPYDPLDLDKIIAKKQQPIEQWTINKIHMVDVYTNIDKTKHYLVGLDPGKGYGTDNTAICILDPYTNRVVATFKSPYISPFALKSFLLELFRKYIPRGILIPERNIAEGLIADILGDPKLLLLKSRLYSENNMDNQSSEKLDANGLLKQDALNRKEFGIQTSSVTRPQMFSLLQEYVFDHKDSFVAPDVIQDLCDLVIKNQKIAAASGKHDDMIMAFNICIFALNKRRKNLFRYGYTGQIEDPDAPSEKTIYAKIEEEKAIRYLQKQGFNVMKEAGAEEEEFQRQMRQAESRIQTQRAEQFNVGDNIVMRNEDYVLNQYNPEVNKIEDSFYKSLNSNPANMNPNDANNTGTLAGSSWLPW